MKFNADLSLAIPERKRLTWYSHGSYRTASVEIDFSIFSSGIQFSVFNREPHGYLGTCVSPEYNESRLCSSVEEAEAWCEAQYRDVLKKMAEFLEANV